MRFLLTLLFVPVVAFAQVDFPFDFETEATTPAFVDFEAAVTTVVPNPNPNDNNPSEYVAQMVRGEGGRYGLVPLSPSQITSRFRRSAPSA